MINQLIQWTALIIAIEAVVEIIVDSKIMLPFRNFAAKISPNFFGELFKCGYCFSVWVAIPAAFIAPGEIFGIIYLDVFLKWILIHRLSNIFHGIISRIFNRQPYHIVFQKLDVPLNNNVEVPDEEESDGKIG